MISGLNLPTSVRFASDGHIFIGEKSGIIKVYDDASDTTPTVVANLTTEVFNAIDRGLMDLELDPQYPSRPYLYVAYAMDGIIGDSLANGRIPRYNDVCNDPNLSCPIGGRLVRLTLSPATLQMTAQSTLIENWGQQFGSHSLGSLHFGSDGYLYVSAGEGASYESMDYGNWGNPLGDAPGPAGTSLTPPSAMGGSLRAQTITPPSGFPRWFGGKVIRVDVNAAPLLDPYNVTNPPAVVAYGLRNPFRTTIRPGTNELWVGDVGYATWEEIDRIPDVTAGSTLNFGWPCYEGAPHQPGYDAAGLTVCQNLYASATVAAPYYAYNHSQNVTAGDTCLSGTTAAVSGLAFQSGSTWPATYQGALFFSDYARQCIWYMPNGADGNPDVTQRVPFLNASQGAGSPITLQVGPDGDLWWLDIVGGQLKRAHYSAGNSAPVAKITVDTRTGGVPLTVHFDGSTSSDADPGDTLTYAWDLNGDGNFNDSTAVSPTFTYTVAKPLNAGLQVTDPHGAVGTALIALWPGQTAPTATVTTSISTGLTQWKGGDTITYSATATDQIDGTMSPSSFQWSVLMMHCPAGGCHTHWLDQRQAVAGGSFVVPSHEYPSHVVITLVVTDSAGISTTVTQELDPITTDVSFNTSPSGLSLGVNESATAAPFTSTFIANSPASISAPAQVFNGVLYDFTGWSDNGKQSHDITVGTTPLSLTATFAKSTATNHSPTANAGAAEFASSQTLVTLDGSASSDVDNDPLSYSWTQTGGPAVTLFGATTTKPYFVAPVVTAQTALTFQLVVNDGISTPTTDSVVVSVTNVPGTNRASTGTPVALIMAPKGGGNHQIQVICDGVKPPSTATDGSLQYDTYTDNSPRPVDWIGYTFPSTYVWNRVLFQEGIEFPTGGWFDTLTVQILQNGTWNAVSNLVITPGYSKSGVNFDTYNMAFAPMAGNGIRIYGTLNGPNTFISVGELEVYGDPPVSLPPTANAGPAQTVVAGATVTLDGSGSSDPDSPTLTYQWSQISGTQVSLSSITAIQPSFQAPAAASTLVFGLTVSDGYSTSAQSTVTVNVNTATGSSNLAALGTPVALITAPTGGGNHNIEVIRDGVKAPVGSNDDTFEYDTFTGDPARSSDWIGYTFPASYTFDHVMFQEGKQFSTGGWFSTLTVQVLQSGTWVNVSGLGISPAYSANGVNYDSYAMSFAPIVGNGIRLYGTLAGPNRFISVGELEVYGVAATTSTGSTNVAQAGSIVALITAPTGGGNHNIQIIRDGVKAPVGSNDDTLEYDTFTGDPTRSADWIGYTFPSAYAFDHVMFQEGKQFSTGGWFSTLSVQAQQSGSWVNVKNLNIAPAYSANGVNFDSYTLTFSPIVATGIRLYGTLAGPNRFISVGELEVYGTPTTVTGPTPNAGPDQTVNPGAIVTLDGTASTDPSGLALQYSWVQVSGPAVTLNGATTANPTFVAPAGGSTCVFGLTVSDANSSSGQDTVTISTAAVAGTINLAAQGTPTALIMSPTGGGNHNIGVIKDGVKAAVGSNDDTFEYDTYTGDPARSVDWIGYTFPSTQTFSKVVYQEGKEFGTGGWFSTLTVQVRQSGTWTSVPGLSITPVYGPNGVNYDTYTLTFTATAGDGIRLYGTLAGPNRFISAGEIEVY